MRNKLVVCLLVVLLSSIFSATVSYALDGTWRGDLSFNGNKLPLVFHFTCSVAGNAQCTIDSPLQVAKGLATQINFCNADSVSLDIKSIGASYSGKIDRDKITGVFIQRGFSFPLELTPEKSIYDRRPQTPQPPFSYTVVDTTFVAPDGVNLAATLTLPEYYSIKTPIVVMVTGSGPQNRDEELFDHRPFAVIADYLARNGVASFRYDDRGTAQSEGDFASSTIATFKSDAESAVNFLRKSNKFKKIGVIGHSEGGTIALMLASQKTVDFAVSLAGAFVAGKDIILAQNKHSLELLLVNQKHMADAMTLLSKVFNDVIQGKATSAINIDDYIKNDNLEIPQLVLASLRKNLSIGDSEYFREFLILDPSKWLGKVQVPILGLNGSLDKQVNSADNLSILKKYVPKAQVKEYSGLNHLFQHATTGEVSEYVEIPETISTEVLDDIVKFIESR